MLEIFEQDALRAKLKRYKRVLDVCRILVFMAVACLAVAYLLPLFSDGEGRVVMNKILVQMGLLVIVLLATVISYKKPFVMFLLLSLFTGFVALAITVSVIMMLKYGGDTMSTVTDKVYWVLIGIYAICGVLVLGTITGRKYERMLTESKG